MTTLIVVRHGQSESNLSRIFAGQTETALTALGRAQAEETARFLDGAAIDKIYASDLSRAMNTARATAKRHGLDIIPRASLREINAGFWEGKAYLELIEQYPEYAKWRSDVINAHPEGGESVRALAARVYAEIDRIVAENRGKTVAVFTHATPVRMLAYRWFGYSLDEKAEIPFCSNASVSIAEYQESGEFHRLVHYGYDKHLTNVTEVPKGIV